MVLDDVSYVLYVSLIVRYPLTELEITRPELKVTRISTLKTTYLIQLENRVEPLQNTSRVTTRVRFNRLTLASIYIHIIFGF